MTLLLYIPVSLRISRAPSFTLLNGRPVSQFSGEHINDFSGRGGVVIKAAGFDAFHVSI